MYYDTERSAVCGRLTAVVIASIQDPTHTQDCTRRRSRLWTTGKAEFLMKIGTLQKCHIPGIHLKNSLFLSLDLLLDSTSCTNPYLFQALLLPLPRVLVTSNIEKSCKQGSGISMEVAGHKAHYSFKAHGTSCSLGFQWCAGFARVGRQLWQRVEATAYSGCTQRVLRFS